VVDPLGCSPTRLTLVRWNVESITDVSDTPASASGCCCCCRKRTAGLPALRPTLLLRASDGDLLFGDAGSDGICGSLGAGFSARVAL
jgi:hypothetical protein